MSPSESTMQPREGVRLAPHTTLAVGGKARFFVEARNSADVVAALTWARDNAQRCCVLGGGSNVVFSDDGFAGLVIKICGGDLQFETLDREAQDVGPLVEDAAGTNVQSDSAGIAPTEPDQLRVRVIAHAGVQWDTLVAQSIERSLGGIECLSGIPGTVGAAPIQNIGAYGQELDQVCTAVHVVDRETLAEHRLPARDCGFGYRTSHFKTAWSDRYVVVAVELELLEGVPGSVTYRDIVQLWSQEGRGVASVHDVREMVLSVRRAKSMVLDSNDPDTRSAGSFFKNPIVSQELADQVSERAGEKVPTYPAGVNVKLPAAWLIEHAGFQKGHRIGHAGLSSKHTLAIVTGSGARSKDVLRVAAAVRRGVRDVLGVTLHPEPSFVGFELDVDTLLESFE